MNNEYSYNTLKGFLDGDLEQIKDLVETFIESTPDIFLEMKSSVDSENWEQLSKDAHKLKSSVKLFELDEIVEEVIFVEKNAVQLNDKELLRNKYKLIFDKTNIIINKLKEDLENWDSVSKNI